MTYNRSMIPKKGLKYLITYFNFKIQQKGLNTFANEKLFVSQ